jgi:acyl carrier protein
MPTTTETVIAIIKDINPQAAADARNTSTILFELGLDSLDHASVLLQVEEQFGIKISDEESETLTTVDAIVARVDAAVASPGR